MDLQNEHDIPIEIFKPTAEDFDETSTKSEEQCPLPPLPIEICKQKRTFVDFDEFEDYEFIYDLDYPETTKMADYEKVVRDVFLQTFHNARSSHTTKGVAALEVLQTTANVLGLEITHCNPKYCNCKDCITLDKTTIDLLDDIWYEIKLEHYPMSTEDRRIRSVFVGSGRHFQTQELTEFLSVLFNRSSIRGRSEDKNEKILKTSQLNEILGVDGFGGLFPSDFKNYVCNLKRDERMSNHLEGVRCMYKTLPSNLTGTDSACIVFLSLSRLYRRQLNWLDCNVNLMMNRFMNCAVSILQRNATYYKELEAIVPVMEPLSERLIDVYVYKFEGKSFDRIALERIEEVCLVDKKKTAKKKTNNL